MTAARAAVAVLPAAILSSACLTIAEALEEEIVNQK